MAKINIETKNKLQFLIENFTEEGINISVYPDRESFTIGNHSLKDLITIYNKLYLTNPNFFMLRKQIKFKEIIENTEISLDNNTSKLS